MKKYLLILTVLFCLAFTSGAQSIQDVQAYAKLDGSRFVALLSDQTIWWYTENNGWQKVSAQGLPQGNNIKFFSSYMKYGLGSKNTRLVAVLDDNSIWWFSEGGNWEKVVSTGLPRGKTIKIFRPYVKISGMGGSETRYVAILDDNSIWWFANVEEWKSVSDTGLPSKYEVKYLGTYQKVGMTSTETRYIVTLADNSIWWYADNTKKWQELEAKGLPSGHAFKQLEAYMKIGGNAFVGTTYEGRLVGVLADESIWWFATNGKEWKKLDLTGLPKGYKIKTMKVYQKNPGLTGETRVILALEDNTIWWYAEGKKWEPVNMKGLKLEA